MAEGEGATMDKSFTVASTGRHRQGRESRLRIDYFESFQWPLGHRVSLVVWYLAWVIRAGYSGPECESWGRGSGPVGLYLKSVLRSRLFSISRNW